MKDMFSELFSDYENTRIITEDEFSEMFPDAVYYDELGDKTLNGVLKANYYENGRLKQVYSDKDNHVCVIAATRQGKTTSFVIPSVLSYARQKVKRHMVITDPKGEIYRTTAETLKKEGYNVLLVNFRDFRHSEYWNPMTTTFRKNMELINLENTVELVETENGPRNKFRGKIYESQAELDYDISCVKNELSDYVDSGVDELHGLLMPVESRQDVTWELGARDVSKSVDYGMLEDVEYEPNPITEDTYSLNTLIARVTTFGRDTGNGTDDGFFTRRDKKSKAYRLAKPYILDTPDSTRGGYLSVLQSKYSEFKETTVRRITSCNSFEFDVFTDSERPTALFIDFRDEVEAHYKLIALFIQKLYTYLIDYTNKCENNRLKNGVLFMLDEFGNMPPLKGFRRVISACGSRNIWFNVVLQSYAQLESVYGKDADIIKDNMNVHIFMGSNNTKTLEEFSRECGKRTRFSPLSALNGSKKEIDNYQIETIPVMPVSRLAHLKPGECVVTEVNSGYVMLSKLERYYMCEEFNHLPLANENEYVSSVNPLDSKYNYDIYKKARK